MSSEPVAIGSAFVAFANAVLALVVLVGLWHATPAETSSASLVVTTGAALASAILVRRKVTPTANLAGDTSSMKGTPPT